MSTEELPQAILHPYKLTRGSLERWKHGRRFFNLFFNTFFFLNPFFGGCCARPHPPDGGGGSGRWGPKFRLVASLFPRDGCYFDYPKSLPLFWEKRFFHWRAVPTKGTPIWGGGVLTCFQAFLLSASVFLGLFYLVFLGLVYLVF